MSIGFGVPVEPEVMVSIRLSSPLIFSQAGRVVGIVATSLKGNAPSNSPSRHTVMPGHVHSTFLLAFVQETLAGYQVFHVARLHGHLN